MTGRHRVDVPTGDGTAPQSCRHDADVDVPAHDLFAFVSQVRNLPRYFPAITRAEEVEAGDVAVEATVNGQTVSERAWLRLEPETHIMRWGATGPDGYHGELWIRERDAGTSTVTVAVHTRRAGQEEVFRELRKAVAALAHAATADADTVDPAAPTLDETGPKTPGR